MSSRWFMPAGVLMYKSIRDLRESHELTKQVIADILYVE